MSTTNFTDATLKGTVTGPTFTGSVDGAKFTGSVTTADAPPIEPPPTIKITRNVFQQPFATTSIWNTPLGKGGGALAATGNGPHGGAQYKYADSTGPVYEKAPDQTSSNWVGPRSDEGLYLFGPSSPMKPVMTNTVGWSGGASARCSATQTNKGVSVPVPPNAAYAGGTGNYSNPCANAYLYGGTPNACGAILLADRHTLYMSQPMHICSPGGGPTTQYFFPNVDLFADDTTTATQSASGSHGGSAMSSLGGAIRFNQLIPGNCPIVPGVADVMRHPLSFGFNGHLFDAFTGSRGHVWPATTSDTGNEGLLLALLPSFNINSLTTPPGRSIAWTLMNYGAYVVDCYDTTEKGINIDTEYSYGDASVNCPTGRMSCQFKQLWTGPNYPMGFIDWTGNSAWFNDLKAIVKNLYVITNNTKTSIGGGGANRLQPLAADPVDQGVITIAPVVTAASFSISHTAAVNTLIGQVSAYNSPYWWTLTGTGAANFWIQPTTGLVYAAIANIAAGTYTLTATAQNIVGSGTGKVVIVVS